MSTGKTKCCITAGRLRPDTTPDPPTPFPEDFLKLQFTTIEWVDFDVTDPAQWNGWLTDRGCEGCAFDQVQVEFGNIVKLAGNLESPTKIVINGYQMIDCDISKLPNLTHVDLSSNLLSRSDIVVGLLNLIYLNLGLNVFNEIDLTSQRSVGNLTTLNVSNNELLYLDVSDITKLGTLTCNYTGISEITGLSFLGELKQLQCTHNNITALDLSACVMLENLICANNPIQNADLMIDYCIELLSLQANDCDFSGTFSYEFNTKCALVNLAGNAVENLTGYESLTIPYNTAAIYLQDNAFGFSEIDTLLAWFSNNAKYPAVLKIDGTGNANIGGDGTVMGYYNDLAANGTIITANI